ncbi:MAG: M36 family metallopeptidase [Deltaproteobacteria bacterium]|nr:M36 family metallopeptidase [Deltaproteobacteria bacterium]
MAPRLSRVLGLSSLLLVSVVTACGSSDTRSARTGEPPSIPPTDTAVTAFVAHRDARLADAPSFMWLGVQEGVKFKDARESAAYALRSVTRSFGLDKNAVAAIETPWIDDHGKGPILAHVKQRVSGIEVFRSKVTIAMRRDFEPVAASGLLAPKVDATYEFKRASHVALTDAYAALLAATHGRATSFASSHVDGDYEHFTSPVLKQSARVKKVLFPRGDALLPAYYVELPVANGPAWGYVVSADDGKVLFKADLVKHEAFTYKAFASPDTKIPFDGPQGNGFAPHPVGAPNGLKPTFGTMNSITLQNYPFSKNDPWLPADATTLAGNNVRAYPDAVQPDGFLGDISVVLTGERAFEHAYDTTLSPNANVTNISAATTQLFYVTNFLHDWFYDAGFDEKSGNNQNDNFGRGGVGKDAIRAEAQDYSGRNNANAQVPPDGAAAIIQMFIFSGPSAADLTVSSPASIAGVKAVGLPGFGLDQFDVSGSVVLANDDQGTDPADACEDLTTNVTGKIVLVHRGLCSFVQKAQKVQAAGGIGVIVANVASSTQPTVPPFMGGTASDVTVPILSLNLADGRALEAALGAGVNVTMHRALQTDLDGAIDNTVVTHEWGHVLSGRLVHDGLGLTTNQAGGLGEGWADFTALLLTARPEDLNSPAGANWAGAYPNGAYAMFGAGADFYFGIRRVPYSVDLAKDPLTFKHTANGTPLPTTAPVSFGEDGSFNAEVHAAGEVWATMLWECYVALLRTYPFQEAQDRMKRYLVASLKLTPADPTFLEARDAVLAAAFAADEKDYTLFWQAFGRRGAGVGAQGAPKDSSTNQGVKESFYVGNDVQIADARITDDVITCDHDGILDPAEVGSLTMKVRNAGTGTLTAPVAKLSSAAGPGIKFLEGAEVKLQALKPFQTQEVKVQAQIANATPIDPITVDVVVSDPSFEGGRTQKVSVLTRYNTDEDSAAATIDRVETRGTTWTVSTTDSAELTKKWERVQSGLEGRWVVPNGFEVAEHRLISPDFTLEGSTFELRFKHKWSFRISTRRQADIDGGVVEVSTDKGKTWSDLGKFGKVNYNSILSTGGRGDNPLAGRDAFGNKSPGYPDQWVTTNVAADLGARPEQVRIRFNFASGTGFSGAPGWEIDEIELKGIASKPFVGFVPQADNCDAKGPVVEARPGALTVKSKDTVALDGAGTHPLEAPLTFVWLQESGPPVTLENNGTAQLKFVAPDVTQPTTMVFALRAHDGRLLSPAARTEVTVNVADPTKLDAGGNDCSCRVVGVPRSQAASFGLGALGLVGVALIRRRRR